jgi:hypothetical protein
MQKILASVFVFFGASIASASAGPITETYIFSLGGFVDVGSDVISPSTDISGSFTVTFDPSKNYTNDTSQLVVHSFSGTPVNSELGFTYFASTKQFFFGGVQNNSDFMVSGTNDFTLSYDLTNPSTPQFLLCSAPGIVCASQTGNSAYTASGYTSADHDSSVFVSASARSVANGGAVASSGPSPSDFAFTETAPSDGSEGQYTITNNSSGWWVTGFEVTNPLAADGDDSTTQTNWTAGVCVSCASLPVFTYSDNVLLDYSNYITPDGGTSSNFFFTAPPDSSVAVDLVNAEGQTFQLALGTPEPSTWAMMLVGFAGLGFAGYRASQGTSGAG